MPENWQVAARGEIDRTCFPVTVVTRDQIKMSKRTLRSSLRRHAFTLVEVLIVVVILAILAGTVIPQFTASSEDAKDSAALYNLHTLRAQIELYKVQHGGIAPTLTTGALPQLTLATDSTGATGQPGTTYPFGPYLASGIPPNPLTGVATITVLATIPPSAESGTDGWLYHAASGQIYLDKTNYLTF